MADSGIDLAMAYGHEGGALPVNYQCIISSTDEDARVSTAYTGKTLRARYNKYHDLWADSGMEKSRPAFLLNRCIKAIYAQDRADS